MTNDSFFTHRQTLTTTSTTPTTTTTQQGNQGPVSQPQTAAAGQTVYTYTTTNANGALNNRSFSSFLADIFTSVGETEGVVATFTPSFGPTATGGSVTAAPGTILNYSSWRGSVGSNTVAVISAGTARWSVQPRWANIGVALCASLTGGAWLALA